MAKHKALVTQHLEDISGEALTEWRDLITGHTKGRQGIYALYRRRKLYYVGLASNLSGRLKAHLRDRHQGKWDRFSVYLTIGDEHMKELESLILRIVQPKGNKVKGKFAKSQNLLPILRKEYRAAMRRKEARLFTPKKRVKPAKPKKKIVKKSKATGKRPPLAPYVEKGFAIKAIVKGKVHRARVRQDGAIRYGKVVYNSPSAAAKVAAGHKGEVNGWAFWTYQLSPDNWVPLKELKKHGPKRGK